VVAWVSKYYATLETNGKFTIINDRLPYKTTFMGKTDFVNSLEDHRLQTMTGDAIAGYKYKFEGYTKIWLESPSPVKKRYLDIALFPREPFDPNKTYFMWRGFATKPDPGDCTLTLAYILDVIANKDEGLNNWILDYLAHMVQKPKEKPEVALLLIGEKGVGKTFFMELVKMLVDGASRNFHVFKTSSANDIFGDHKAPQLLHTLVLLLEEVTFGGDVKNRGQLNELISGHTTTINLKHGAMLVVDNVMRVILAANPGHAILASEDERRYTAADVSSEHRKDHAYFAALQKELDRGGYSALMHKLMTRDISNFNRREAYVTDALVNQIDQGMSIIEQWWFNILKLGQIPFITSLTEDGYIRVSKQVLYEKYKRDMKVLSPTTKILFQTKFGEALHALVPKVENDKAVTNEKNRPESALGTIRATTASRPWLHVIPPLQRTRKLFEFKRKRTIDWDQPDEWEELVSSNDAMLPNDDGR
jgi:Family of unknown function (DUF5906)